MELSDNITKVKQISTKYEVLLNKLGIFTVKDLLTYFPVKYNDTSKVSTIRELTIEPDESQPYTIRVKIEKFRNAFLRSRKTLQTASAKDETGIIKLNWFNQNYLEKTILPGKEFLFYGKIKIRNGSVEFYPQIYEEVIEQREVVHLGRITPEYALTEGITKKWFRNRIKYIVDNLNTIEVKDELAENGLTSEDIKEALKNIHFSEDLNIISKSIEILSLYELINIQLKLEKKREQSLKLSPPIVDYKDLDDVVKEFISNLPFKLTVDQKKLLDNLLKKLKGNKLLNELIQGDVGSGKTIIAIIMSLAMSLKGYQVAILAPTTILAKQHHINFSDYLAKYGFNIQLVTGDIKKESEESKKGSKGKGQDGRARIPNILIGTSAILARQKDIIKKIGLVVVDEEHKFGVRQREDLLKPFRDIIDASCFPHFINMSATPIPRSIAQAFFGDISINFIKTKPEGRLPIKTFLVDDEKRSDCYKWVSEKVKKDKEQVYWVCPLVAESEKLDATAAEAIYKELTIKLPNLRIGLMHGQMKENEKMQAMKTFQDKEYDILVSTSVIEVGIDVTNATTMVIESSERFGLAQLHQIRGRVGRSNKQSWCFLFHSKDAGDMALKRLKFLSENTDGLKIAEFDLANRGPGEIYGTRQSGIPNLKIAQINNLEIIKKSRSIAEKLYKKGIREIELFS